MANQWFKFYGVEYIGDQKMLAFSASERSCWVTLLCYASQDNGIIKYLDENTLMIQAGVEDSDHEKVRGILKKFQKLEMIRFSNGRIEVVHWKKRQENHSEAYERVKKWREKKRGVTLQSNARIDKNRIDKNRIDTSMSAIADASFEEFWKEYPKKELKKKTQEIWKRKKLSSFLEEILKFIASAKLTDRWKKGFVRQPPVFLNNECWKDDLSSYGDNFKNDIKSMDYSK